MQIKNLLLAAVLISICLPLASAITINVRDSTTGTYLNSTINITYNNYDSYQETATVATTPVQKATGNYYLSNTTGYMYINYSKPDRAINASWERITGLPKLTNNATLDWFGCWEAYTDQVVLRIKSTAGKALEADCYDGATWENMYTSAVTSASFPLAGSAGSEARTYDADNTTYACWVNNTVYNWTTFTGGNNNCYIYEEKVFWKINGTNDLETAPSGTVVPSRAVNYTTANVTISSGGYGSTSLNNLDLSLSSYTFNLTTSNNVTFRVLDETTGAIVNTTNVQLSSTVYGTNGTTVAGTITFSNLTYGLYTVTYNATGYSQRTYNILLPSTNSETIILYLLSSSLSTTVRFTVADTTNFRLTNATVYLQKKNSSGTNYYLVATCTTDTNGQCVSNLNIIDTTYKFLVYYNGAFRANSLDTVVTSTEVPITVSLIGDPLDEYFAIPTIGTSLTYSNGLATWTVADSSGNVQQGCVRLYRRTAAIVTELNGTCTTGSSFTISTYANNSLGDENYALGTVYINGQQYQVQRLSEDNNELAGAGSPGLLMLAVVFAVGITLAFKFSWDVTTALVMFMVSTTLFWSVGMIQLSSFALISFLILMMLFIARNKQ